MTFDELLAVKEQSPPPTTICLCGSTRFFSVFQEMNLRLTLEGYIVLSIGCDTKSDKGFAITEREKVQLDVLHLFKIDRADEVLILNVGRYVGESTQREIDYAHRCNKPVRYLEE